MKKMIKRLRSSCIQKKGPITTTNMRSRTLADDGSQQDEDGGAVYKIEVAKEDNLPAQPGSQRVETGKTIFFIEESRRAK